MHNNLLFLICETSVGLKIIQPVKHVLMKNLILLAAL